MQPIRASNCGSTMATGGAAEELSRNIRDQFLQCKICLDGLKEPKTLPCLHTFCAECIICYAEHNIIDNRKFACPICRRNIYVPKNGIEGFPDSFFVASLNDVIMQSAVEMSGPKSTSDCGICKFKEAESTATVMCVDCKIELCEECAKTHGTARITADHTLLPLGNGPFSSITRDNYCRIHRTEMIKYYCETCNSPVCLPCTFLEHQSHEVAEIKSVRNSFAEGMSQLVQQSEDSTLQLEQARDDLIELENELFVRKESAKTEVRRSIQDVIRNLNDQEVTLLGEVDGYFNTVTVAQDRQKIERTIFRLNRAHDFAKQLLSEQTSPIAQLVNRNDAKENLTQALAYELPDITQHACKLDDYMYFLPGNTDLSLGNLLKGNGTYHGNAVTNIRHKLPSMKALFLYKLRVAAGSGLGEVISIGMLPNGDTVVLTTEGKKIKVFNKCGKLRYEFADDDELQHPSDMVVTREGDIAVSDCGFRCVKIFDSIGSLNHSFGGDDDTFGLPIALTTDQTGRFLVCDQAKERVTVHRQSGELVFETNTMEVKTPQYIACHNGRVFICDAENNTIAVYTYTRDALELVTKLTTPTGDFTGFLDCSGICCDNSGNLLVADSLLDRIHVFNEKAELSHILPSGKQFMQPGCLSASIDNLLAVCQRGVSLDPEVPTNYEVCIYRLVRADI